MFFNLFKSDVDYRNTSSFERRQIVDKIMRTGRFADITYRKKTTGEVVCRRAKLWVERHLTSGNRNIVGVNVPASLDNDLYPYSDFYRDEFRSLSLRSLVSIKTGNKTYRFN